MCSNINTHSGFLEITKRCKINCVSGHIVQTHIVLLAFGRQGLDYTYTVHAFIQNWGTWKMEKGMARTGRCSGCPLRCLGVADQRLRHAVNTKRPLVASSSSEETSQRRRRDMRRTSTSADGSWSTSVHSAVWRHIESGVLRQRKVKRRHSVT